MTKLFYAAIVSLLALTPAQALVIGEVQKDRLPIACTAVLENQNTNDDRFAECKNFAQAALEERIPSHQEIELRISKLKKIKGIKELETITKGKGTWVNVWNYPTKVDEFMTRLRRYDIDTIYLQVNRSNTPVFRNAGQIDEILRKAHQNNIKVIGWSYCYLNNISGDVDRFVKPALYQTSDGHKFDGMAADIEENIRESAVERYTQAVKDKLPSDYPLLAIVFSPRIRPNYPWKYIGANWDVLMPMTYWHGMKNKHQPGVVENFVTDTVENIRKYTGRDDVSIHLITDGERTTPEQIATSLEVARKLNITGGISIYPEHLATDEMLEVIRSY